MFNKKGQNIAEYAILIALVIAAAVAMQVYVKRGIQGRVADATDYAVPVEVVQGEPVLNFDTKQYEPYYLDQSSTVVSDRSLQEQSAARGDISRTGVVETTGRAAGSYEASDYQGDVAR